MFCQAKSMKTPGVHLKSQMFSPSYTERRMYQSLPNPYGWNKSWKLRNLRLKDNSPALHQKSSPLALEAWSIPLADHHKNDPLWRPRDLAQTTPPLPNKTSNWYWTTSRSSMLGRSSPVPQRFDLTAPFCKSSLAQSTFDQTGHHQWADHCQCHQQSTPKLLGFYFQKPP